MLSGARSGEAAVEGGFAVTFCFSDPPFGVVSGEGDRAVVRMEEHDAPSTSIVISSLPSSNGPGIRPPGLSHCVFGPFAAGR